MSYYDLKIKTGSDYSKIFTLKNNGVAMDLTAYEAYMYIVESPGTISSTEFSTVGGNITNGGVDGTLTLSLSPSDIATISGNFYKLEINDGLVQTEILSGNIFILDEDKSGVEYLLPQLRLHLGDTDPLTYRYMDEWLKMALIAALKSLQRWWGDKYTVDLVTGLVTRGDADFLFDEPPTIQARDERPIILMASILIKSGSMEANSWNVGSWKDAEIAVSNIEGNRAKEFGLKLDWEELKSLMTPPTKRLSGALRIAHPSTEE